jgi:catalase
MNYSSGRIRNVVAASAMVITLVILLGAGNTAAGQEMGAGAKSNSQPPKATPETFVDALNSTFGKQTTNRATHAKGIVLLGRFSPSAEAQSLSKAPHFKQAVPITVRFSDNTGLPKLADAAPLATPHGLAIKFHLPDGTETDLVTHSYNGFPTSTADDQRLFFIAVGSSGPGVASPTPLEKFMMDHPAVKAFLTAEDPPPVSYGTITYFGVNSFKFTNGDGKVTFGRYQIIPVAGRHFLSKEEIAKATPDYLTEEIGRRVTKAPVQFKLVLQLAASGDKIDDPAIAWADTNKVVDLGIIEITSVVPNPEATDQALLFMPGLLPVGIEPADPMIQFRNKTYPVSYDRRHQ